MAKADTVCNRPWVSLYPDSWRTGIENPATSIVELFRRAVAARGPSPAIFYFDGLLSFDRIDRQSDALASWLQARGASPGDRLCLILQNVPQFVIALLAGWKCGMIVVPTNPMYRATELARIFADCRPAAVVVHDDGIDAAWHALASNSIDTALLATSPTLYQSRDDARILPQPAGTADPRAEGWGAVLEEFRSIQPLSCPVSTDDIALLPYTSGTTGVPKGVQLTHGALAYNAQWFHKLAGLDRKARILALAPFFHITGFTGHLGAALSAQCPMILHYRVHPGVVLDALREHRPTYTIGVITAFNALAADDSARPQDFASFRRVATGGAPVAAALRDTLRDRLGISLDPAYGMTETSAQAIYAPPDRPAPVHPDWGSLSTGIPTPGTDVRIVDSDGADLPLGEPGELWVRGPQLMTGYWGRPDDTAATMSGGWLLTGDVAVMDPLGWIYLVDRQKDVIIASGFKVWPREVEDVLYAHRGVKEAAVFGVPDPYRGETVFAYVAPVAGQAISANELARHCHSRLAAYKRPQTFRIVSELPKTPTGKIQKNLLRDLEI